MSYETIAALYFGFEVTEEQWDEDLAEELGLRADMVGSCHADKPTYVVGVCAYRVSLNGNPIRKVGALGAPRADKLDEYAEAKGVKSSPSWLLTVERF